MYNKLINWLFINVYLLIIQVAFQTARVSEPLPNNSKDKRE